MAGLLLRFLKGMVGVEERVGSFFLIPRRKKRNRGMENVLDRVSTMDAKREFVASFQHRSHCLLRVSQICNPPVPG